MDVAIPFPYSFVLAHPDLVCNLVDKTKVVGYEDDTTFEPFDRSSQSVDCINIQVIRWLIQQQDVVGFHRHDCKHQAGLLTVTQHANICHHLLLREAKHAQVAAPYFLAPLNLAWREHLLHEAQRTQIVLQDVSRMLMELSEHQVLVLLDLALCGTQLPAHEFDQGRFATTIRANECNTRVTIDSQVQFGIQVVLRFATVGEGDVVEGEHRRLQPRACLKLEGQGLLAPGRTLDCIILHFFEHFLLRLCTRRNTVRLVDADEILQLLHIGLLLLVLLQLQSLLLLHDLDELRIVAPVVRQGGIVKPHRVCANSVQEVLRVGDHEQTLVVFGQVLLQPNASLQV
mmetsp:Transcript_75930/g.217405  ORF Transcript_75930/g.217405 Transcript_75930/m.217405 type:complete len:343 (-) Transcript_75930:772-1800(-)